MDLAYTDHDLTLQKIMDSSSEMEYIAEERNLIPSVIEQICANLTDDDCDCMNVQLSHTNAYSNKILVWKKSVDYLESSGYNLFRQFESDRTWECFERPVTEKSNGNGTEKFTIKTTLVCALDTYTHLESFPEFRVLPFRPSSEYIENFVRHLLPNSPNRLDDTTTGRNSPATNIFINTLFCNYDESELRNSGTPAVASTQNNGNTTPMNSSVRSGNMQDLSESSAAKIVNNSYSGIFRTKSKRNSYSLRLHYSSNDENNVKYEVPATRGGLMENNHIATTSFSPTLSDDNSLSSDSLEVGIAANMECRNPGNSRFQSEEFSESAHTPTDDLNRFERQECSESPQTPTDDFDRFERQEYQECEQNRNGRSARQESGHSKLSGIIDILQDSEGFVQSIEITTDDQVQGTSEKPLVDLSLVWNRRYCDSNNHVTFKLTHPLHYKRECDRIRQSRLSVFDSLMSRQTNGPLSQRKVLEVVARPYYNIFPPADETDIKRQSVIYDSPMDDEGYLRLNLKTSRWIESRLEEDL